MPELPSGTVAFLFTDIEGSTKRWQRDARAMAAAVARHDAVLRETVEHNEGAVFKTVGDAFCVTFPTAVQAVTAAVDAQRMLVAEEWGAIGPICVRMAVHVGAAEERDNDYFGPAVNRVARLLSAGHGSQILLSAAATELVRDDLPPGTTLRDLGEHRLKDLDRPERIYQLIAPGLQAEFAPLAIKEHHPHNLPPQLTSVVGRGREVREIRDQLARQGMRLVTLTGPGGVGKTRLSLEVGSASIDDYPDGIWFAALDEATDEAAVATELAKVFSVREVADLSLVDSIMEYLRDKHLLLILDNFEQVTHAAPLVSRLLRAAPRVQAVVTSRARLGVQGEHEFVVPPLEVPKRRGRQSVEQLLGCSAISLFVERAQAAKNGFALTDTNAEAVTEICRGLDSLPLAIELAAARVKMLPPEALLTRMEQRLSLVTGGRGDRPNRHQTLRATISWSFELLRPAERLLFARLAVFAGGFTLEATETVCNHDGQLDIFTSLESLVDHSLVRQSESATGDVRFAMLTTIREFAAECLQALPDDASVEQHLSWCIALAEEAEPALAGPDQQTWLDRLETEHDNIRAALAWSRDAWRVADLLRLGGAMSPYWEMRGYLSEGRRWLSSALDPTEDVPEHVLAKALRGLGNLMLQQGDHVEAAEAHGRGLAVAQASHDSHLIGQALIGLAAVRLREGDIDEADRLFTEGRLVLEEAGDPWGAAIATNGLAEVALDRGEFETAQKLYEQGIGTFRALGDKRNIAITLNNLATVAHDRKDYARASALYEQAVDLSHVLADRRTLAKTLNNQGIAAHDQGEYSRAIELYEESLDMFRDLGDRRGMAYLALNLGFVMDDQGDSLGAISRYEDALALFEAIGDQRGAATAWSGMGTAALHLGDTERASQLHLQALKYWQDHEDTEGMVESLDGLAKVVAARGDFGAAVRLFAAGASLHEADKVTLSPTHQAEYDRIIGEARLTLGEEEFANAWTAGASIGVAAATNEALRLFGVSV